ncbi:TRIO domain containing protein [Novymonas esmeraldas]|uniref:TRIO domain containing protein n=1 Tax=Novymonas esmeraldas TaxID=1808958 RepID=A0AAW0F391_9TRYP
MFTPPATEKEARGVAQLRERLPPSLLDTADVDFLDDNAYLRFLRARKGDVDKAADMLRFTIEWRKLEKPYALTAEDARATMAHAAVARGGRCKAGCPVLAIALLEPDGLSMEARKRTLYYMMEETRRKGYDRVTWVVDWGHMSKEKRDRAREKGENERKDRKEVMQSMLDHYPERLEKFLLFRPPFLMRLMLTFVRFSLDSTTSNKVHNAGGSVAGLEKFVDLSQLPVLCEGTMTGTVVEQLSELPDLRAANAAQPGTAAT